MPVTNQAYPFSTIAEKIRLRLVTGTELATEYVRLVGADQYRYDLESPMVAIRPIGPRPYVDAGGGRRARWVQRTIRVYISIRSSLDFVGDDRVALPILFNLEDVVNDYLDDWWPMNDSGGEPVTLEPLHPIDSSAGPPVRKVDDDVGEIFSRLDFDVTYLQVNNTPAPA